jgi:rRNA-processing protein FCF1
LIVEIFNNAPRCAMATMNFSIPDDVKEAFNKAFEGENKSAVVASLMRKAVEERERSRRSGDFVERMRRIRASGREVTEEEIRRARLELRE